jgi:DNA-binding MarR family transcriptional regulator
MSPSKRTPAGEAATRLVLDLFRLSNGLAASGDRLVAPLGLTSARWQILGAIVGAEHPQPVAWLARDLGVSRQNVARIVGDLAEQGLVALQPNPHHRRAPLVVLTHKGAQAFEEAMGLQAPWINRLVDGLGVTAIETTHEVIAALRRKLEAQAA